MVPSEDWAVEGRNPGSLYFSLSTSSLYILSFPCGHVVLLFTYFNWMFNWGHASHPPRPSHKHPPAWDVSITLLMPKFQDRTPENWGTGGQAPAQASHLPPRQPKGRGRRRNHWPTAGPFQICTVTREGRVMTPGDQHAGHSGPLGSLPATSLPAVVPGSTQEGQLLSFLPLLEPQLPEVPGPVQQLKQTKKKMEVHWHKTISPDPLGSESVTSEDAGIT